MADEAETKVQHTGRDKSFVYDLTIEPGTVRVRVASVPRSTEVQPGFVRFDTFHTPTTFSHILPLLLSPAVTYYYHTYVLFDYSYCSAMPCLYVSMDWIVLALSFSTPPYLLSFCYSFFLLWHSLLPFCPVNFLLTHVPYVSLTCLVSFFTLHYSTLDNVLFACTSTICPLVLLSYQVLLY